MSTEELNKALDDLSLRILELINQHVTLANNLELSMRNGWLHLSKTRCIVGYGLSWVAQHDNRERYTSFPVEVKKTEMEPWPHFCLQGREEAGKDAPLYDEVTARFGVLNPHSAKECRASFQKCAELALELATVRSELVATQKKFMEVSGKDIDASL